MKHKNCRISIYLRSCICLALLSLSGCRGCAGTLKYPEITTTSGKNIPDAIVIPNLNVETKQMIIASKMPDVLPTSTNQCSETTAPITSPSESLIPSHEISPGWIAYIDSAKTIKMITTDGLRTIKLPKIYTSENGYYYPLSWSSDGGWISFLSDLRDPLYYEQVYLTNVNQQETLSQQTFNKTFKFGASIAPDGERIVFSQLMGNIGDPAALFILDTRNKKSSQLTESALLDAWMPVWSPIGETIAFFARAQGETDINVQLMLIESDGTNLRKLTDGPFRGSILAWSPDGTEIAYGSPEGCGDIHAVSVQDGSTRILTSGMRMDANPSWSPDGKYLAIISTGKCQPENDDRAGWGISIIKADGSGEIYHLSHLELERKTVVAWCPKPALAIGYRYVITPSGANLNLREAPSLEGHVIIKLSAGNEVDFIEGPIEADGYSWWKMRVDGTGEEGWAVEAIGWYDWPKAVVTP